MDIFEIIKKIKNIQPDESFKQESKRVILSEIPFEYVNIKKIFSPRIFFLRVFETGVGVALAGLFIVIISGGFMGNSVSPMKFSAIDPKTLQAEAQAIDIQIKLANLNYSEPMFIAQSTQKLTTAVAQKTANINNSTSSSMSSITTKIINSSSSTTTISIDEALKALEQ